MHTVLDKPFPLYPKGKVIASTLTHTADDSELEKNQVYIPHPRLVGIPRNYLLPLVFLLVFISYFYSLKKMDFQKVLVGYLLGYRIFFEIFTRFQSFVVKY